VTLLASGTPSSMSDQSTADSMPVKCWMISRMRDLLPSSTEPRSLVIAPRSSSLVTWPLTWISTTGEPSSVR